MNLLKEFCISPAFTFCLFYFTNLPLMYMFYNVYNNTIHYLAFLYIPLLTSLSKVITDG